MEKIGTKAPLAFWPLTAIALLQMLVHFMTNGNYGMFRDEFYYIACADHLAWGYVDHPPFSILLLALSKSILGISVQSIRLLATISGGILVLMVGHAAREMGGNKIAQIIADQHDDTMSFGDEFATHLFLTSPAGPFAG